MSVRLYVGNLPKEVVEREKLQEMFAEGDSTITTKVIKDRKTGKCRGFAFVTVPTDEMADILIEKFNGQSFMESPLKIEKALPRAKTKAEDGEKPETPAPKVTTSSSQTPSSGGGSSKKKQRSKRQNSTSSSSQSSSTQSGSFQPDPRWANELAVLKERLAAQTANS